MGDDHAIERVEAERQRDIDHRDDAGGRVVELLDRLVVDSSGSVMTPLAPMNSTMPNSLTVSSRQRLPPASSAGMAAGRMIWRMMRHGRAPRLLATSICAVIDQREGGEQRAHDEGRVDRDLGEDHAPRRIEEIDRRQRRDAGAASAIR